MYHDIRAKQWKQFAEQIDVFFQSEKLERLYFVFYAHDRTFDNVQIMKFHEFYLWIFVDFLGILQNHFPRLVRQSQNTMHTDIQRCIFQQFHCFFKILVRASAVDFCKSRIMDRFYSQFQIHLQTTLAVAFQKFYFLVVYAVWACSYGQPYDIFRVYFQGFIVQHF